MKRKSFIKKAAAATAGSVVLPYILPSGRLFAATPDPKSEYVVYVLFAGGVRQQESVLQGYLHTSQELDSSFAGNIMPNMLQGALPTRKIAFGTTSPGGTRGDTPIPKILNNPLVDEGVLFKGVRAVNPGHYGGLNSLLTGNRSVAQGLKVRPNFPTIFEYARKHLGLKATETWFIGNTIFPVFIYLKFAFLLYEYVTLVRPPRHQHNIFCCVWPILDYSALKCTFDIYCIIFLSHSKKFHAAK